MKNANVTTTEKQLTAQQIKSKANFEYKNFTGSIFKVLNYILESKESYHLDYCKLKNIDLKVLTVDYIFDRMTVREQFKLNKAGEIIEKRLIHSYHNVMNAIVREKNNPDRSRLIGIKGLQKKRFLQIV